jgi:hypothetical protein
MAFLKTRYPKYKELLALKDLIPNEPALVSTATGWRGVPDLRTSEVRFIRRSEFAWVYTDMQALVRSVQSDLGLDSVLKIDDNIQIGTYNKGDHYGWHRDGRTLSLSILLSDNFSGGRLEFKEPGAPKLGRAGDAVFFTDTLHRVKPVLTGVRDSLVVWWT